MRTDRRTLIRTQSAGSPKSFTTATAPSSIAAAPTPPPPPTPPPTPPPPPATPATPTPPPPTAAPPTPPRPAPPSPAFRRPPSLPEVPPPPGVPPPLPGGLPLGRGASAALVAAPGVPSGVSSVDCNGGLQRVWGVEIEEQGRANRVRYGGEWIKRMD
ncbi:unnamed protein product [Closterium sp. NIES-53]